MALSTFQSHSDEITQVKFSGLQPGVFASSSADCTVKVWDIKKIGGNSF